jgi:hypothetical protein
VVEERRQRNFGGADKLRIGANGRGRRLGHDTRCPRGRRIEFTREGHASVWMDEGKYQPRASERTSAMQLVEHPARIATPDRRMCELGIASRDRHLKTS